jgi:selenocysteine lyase/cysteine desulfurase
LIKVISAGFFILKYDNSQGVNMHVAVSKPAKINIEEIQKNIVGYEMQVPLLDGSKRQYINFDNAASTPSLKTVADKVNEFMRWYSSIHRGTGFKSQLCSEAFDHSRHIVANFVNVDPETHAIIFVKNATEAINKLAHRFPINDDQVVLVSKMEHHSNDLPWRANAKVVHIDVKEDGSLDEEDLISKLKQYHGKVALVALTGASNVSGWVNDINHLAEVCHEHGTKIVIDAAQLAPHRAIDMKAQDNPGHIDFLALSAHKIYAPFGSGVLIGDKDFFETGDPDYVGGGTVDIVSLDYAHWTEAPEKEEAGTPNTVGVIAMAEALQTLNKIGMDVVAEHEKELTHYMLSKMKDIDGIQIYGSGDPDVVENRLGVIAFNIQDLPHAHTASILNYEGGVGVRNGCFCAHPYIKILLGTTEEESHQIEQEILNGDRSRLPGAVRASFGIYNSKQEIDDFIDVLKMIAKKQWAGDYILNKHSGEYSLNGKGVLYQNYFRL